MITESLVIQTENSLAGCLLIEPIRVLTAIRGIVSYSDFLTKQAAAIYRATSALADSGKPIDANLIAAEAGDAVTVEYCAECMRLTPTTVNSAEYAKLIHEAAQERRACQIGLKLADGNTTPVEALAALQELLRAQSCTVYTPGDAAQRVMDFISDAASGKTKPFTRTGYGDLDGLLTGGLVAGGLITIAARPGTGKTTVALNIAENVARDEGPVLYISLEMTLQQLWACRIASASGLGRSNVYSGNIRSDDAQSWRLLSDTMQVLSNRPFYVRDVPSTLEDIEREARCIDDLALIVVDHIGLAKPTVKGSRYELMTDTAHRLKQLALSLQIPIVALCQLNRQSVQRESKRPTMADLRDSGAIEEDSDVVALLFREAEYLPEHQRPKPWEDQDIDVIVDKNRHGRTGIVTLTYNGSISRISG